MHDRRAAPSGTLPGAVLINIPESSAHTFATVGVGSPQRLRSGRWKVAGRIVWAWVLTIPASAAMAMICWLLIDWGRKLF